MAWTPFFRLRRQRAYELRAEPLFQTAPIWRLLRVDSRCRLDLLAEVVVAAFGLSPANHLFVGANGLPSSWSSDGGESAQARLADVLRQPGEVLIYWHGGFGGAPYNLRLERQLPPGEGPLFDCLAGEGAHGAEQGFSLDAVRERLARFDGVPL